MRGKYRPYWVSNNSAGWYVCLYDGVIAYLLNDGTTTYTEHPESYLSYYFPTKEDAEEALSLYLLTR